MVTSMEIITVVGEFGLTHLFGNIEGRNILPPTLYKVLIAVTFIWFVVNSCLWWYDFVTARNGKHFSKFTLLSCEATTKSTKDDSELNDSDIYDLLTNRCIVTSFVVSLFCVLILTVSMVLLTILFNLIPVYITTGIMVLLALVAPTLIMRRIALKPIKVEEKLKYGVD